jgi:glycosyltransferase involved in cell wall biosynthesis
LERENKNFIVHWHGYIVPFYGLKTVMEATEILKDENIEFRIITRFNKEFEKIKKVAEKLDLKNVRFFPEASKQEIVKKINEADVCLGVFGNNRKAQVVIPNKIVEAIACGKAVITGRQDVLKEVFVEDESILMCEPENPKDLANKILELKNNQRLREEIGKNGYDLFLTRLKPKILIKESLLNNL